MGCDIHAHLEIKWKGKWMYYSPLKILRNYDLFSLLADVRNVGPNEDGYVKPFSKPRGLPKDVTEMTKLHSDNYGEDGHSHSWINSQEYVKAVHDYSFDKSGPNNFFDKVYLFGSGFSEFFEFREDYPKELEDFRMVFWFDN